MLNGGGNMAGKHSGVATHILQENSLALYILWVSTTTIFVLPLHAKLRTSET